MANKSSELSSRQFASIVARLNRLNRSRAGSASTGQLLENIFKLFQVLAIVVGGAWILLDYFEFKKINGELTIRQLQLANETAQITQASVDLNNRLSQVKLSHITQGRLEITADSNVMRSTRTDPLPSHRHSLVYDFGVNLTESGKDFHGRGDHNKLQYSKKEPS
jgi:hypothetical protein